MAPGALQKVYITLGVIIGLSWTSLADNEVQNRSKYKYGYVISHKGGSTQAHLESRDGNLALGRYYVNLQNGTGQKVTYFADDLGFHSGVSYSSQNGKGSSKAHIAVGHKALAAFGDSDVKQSTAVFTPTLLFGKKILQTALNTVTSKPGAYPQLNYTPVPGGFFLTQQSFEPCNHTADQRGHLSDLTPSGLPTHEDTYSAGVPQSKSNTQTFYPTSENVKNIINELRIESTTPSIKTYTPLPQHSSPFATIPDEASGLSQRQNAAKVSSYAVGLDDLSYLKQKSIEKTTFADIDAQLISEVQKHAEGIIMKDLQRDQQANEIARLSTGVFQPSTVTMQPIVVTNDGETGLNTVLATTALPEARKLTKASYSDSVNYIQTTGKNPDQALEDSAYFRVSLSPSLSSSINVSQTPHQSINVESTDRNSDSNNSTLCGFNLCEKDDQILSADLSEAKSKKKIEGSASTASDASESLGTNKIIQTFYPENKVHDERHYITTIDVQKAISLDVNQNEAGSIHFARSFPFDKIKPFSETQTPNPTPQPLAPAQISVTPAPLDAAAVSLNFLSTPQKPYISNVGTAAPGPNDSSNQNLAVFNGLNDITSSQYGTTFQDRVETNRYEYENQLVVPPPPVDLTKQAAEDSAQNPQEDFKEVEKSIQELRQQVLSDIDAQHEEEQRKQNLVDQERKQYLQNLQKVEALKKQNSLSYRLPLLPQSNPIPPTISPPISAGIVSNVQLVPQTQYVSSPQISYDSPPQPHYEPTHQSQYNQLQQAHYETSAQTKYDQPSQAAFEPSTQTYQTEIKDFRHEIAVPQPSIQQIAVPQPSIQQIAVPQPSIQQIAVPQPGIQQIANLEVYQKPAALPYDSREVQTSSEARQYSLYNSQSGYIDSNTLQRSVPTYRTENIQMSNYPTSQVRSSQVTVALQPRYAVPRVATVQEKPKQVQQLTVLKGAVGVLPQTAKVPVGKTLLLNNVLPFDYSRYLQVQQPLSLLQTYPVALPSESKIVPGIYPVPIQISQSYKLAYPELGTVVDKQYHSTLTQRPTNKLRVQPLKPSIPDESSQMEAVQNLLSQPQFQRTYLYPGFPIDNRLQLRYIRKNQISNSDQVRSQSVRRAKSLKNLRIEYGFKPPLRPSVEFSEEVKPSIYGSSVQPQ